ncbi:MAG TPA: choice-of-anchor D domain-containing protein, partial [Candidatus Dormibacteraeota bacterium]|nr:choice-of-anchor D domain-containing protein [Candidatus Dormibacteraeota bacterium]
MAVAPDGRLFVGTVSGNIYALTIDSITHQVTSTVKFTSVHNLPNTNDDGTPASVTGRIVLGMTFDPAHPTDLYVSDGDPRLYTCSTNTRSGTITKVDIGSGTAVNVVTGLPKSRRDHNVEGIHFGPDGFLYVSVGAMTNLGAPSVWFGMQAESYLSASILKIDVHSIESSPGSVDLSNVIGASTMPATVSFFVEGTRNAFDFQFEQVNGTTYMYINDNGSNHGFGTTPAGGDGCPSGQAIDPPDLEDTLFRVPLNHLGIFYAGHPNPARGQCVLDDGVSADGTMLYSPTLTPDPNYQPPVMYYGASGGSVNGMTVYPAGVNGGAMAGDLISATFSDDNLLRRVTVDPTSELPTNIPVGSTLAPTSEYQFRNPLTLAADGISGALLGTIFVAESDLWTAGTAEIDALFPQGGGQESLGTLNPTNYNFGSSDVLQAGGWLSAPRQSFAFTNTSGLPINISGVALGGANPSDFQVGSACGGSLAVGASCTVNVTSTPGSIGEKTASVVISDDAPDSPQKIQVMEAGVIQQFGTGTLSFPLTRIGATASQTVTFTNPTSIGTPIHVSQVALTGSGAADYSLTDGCTGHGVAGQQSCSVTVFFTPTVLGSLPANLVLKDDASGSQATTPITGSGGRGFFFAEGFTGTGFTESLNLLMPNQSGTATIDYYTPWAHTTQSVNLTAGKVATVDVAAVVSAPQQPVSALVTLPAEGVAERVMHFNFGQWHGSTDIVGTQSTAEEWDFAEGSTLPAFDEYLTLQNPNPVPANATLNYFTDSGANPIKQLILPAQSRTTVEVFSGGLNSVSGCVPGGAGANCGVGRGQGGVGVKVTTDQPVVVERPMYVDGHDFGSGPINDGHVALGANSPATQWNFAEGT